MRLHQEAVPLASGMTRTREEYRPRCVADLGTPLVWSLVAGVTLGGFAAIFDAPPRIAAGVGIGVFALAFLVASWPVIAGGPDRTHVWEEWLQRDLDGDGIVGQPERPRVPVQVDVTDGKAHRYLNIDVTAPMALFASRLLEGTVDFSERGALSCKVGDDRMSKADFLALRDQLLARGIIRWKNPDSPQSGYDFLGGFHATLRAIVDHSPGGE